MSALGPLVLALDTAPAGIEKRAAEEDTQSGTEEYSLPNSAAANRSSRRPVRAPLVLQVSRVRGHPSPPSVRSF